MVGSTREGGEREGGRESKREGEGERGRERVQWAHLGGLDMAYLMTDFRMGLRGSKIHTCLDKLHALPYSKLYSGHKPTSVSEHSKLPRG